MAVLELNEEQIFGPSRKTPAIDRVLAFRNWLRVVVALTLPIGQLPAQTPPKSPLPVLQSDPLPPGAVRRLGTNRLRIGGPVGYFMFSPDDRTLMVGSGGSYQVHFWETKTWRETSSTSAIAFSCSPDGKHIAKLTGERTIEFWDVAKKTLVHARDLSRFERNARVFDIEFNSSGDALWIGISNRGAWLYNWTKDEIVQRINAPDVLELSLTQSRDRKTLALKHSDYRIAVHDGDSGKLIREFRNGSRHLGTWQALNHDGKILATNNQKSGVAFWDVTDGKTLTPLPSEVLKDLTSRPVGDDPPPNPNVPQDWQSMPQEHRYLFDSKGSHFLVAGSRLAVFDLAQKKVVAQAPLSASSPTALAISNDNTMLALGFMDGTVEVRELLTLKPLVDDPHPRGPTLGVAFARDGRSLATFHDAKTAVRLWNLRDGGLAKAFDIDYPNDTPDALALSFLPGDRALTLGARYRWNLTTGAREPKPDHKGRLVAASADGHRWLLLKENDNQEVKEITLHDAAAQRELCKFPLDAMGDASIPSHSVHASLSADGSWIGLHTSQLNVRNQIIGEMGVLDDKVVVWQANGAKPVPVFSLSFEPDSSSIALSLDGRFLSLRGTSTPEHPHQLWHMPTGFSLWKIEREKAIAEKKRSAGVRDFEGEEFAELNLNMGSGGDVVAFSPDAQLLAVPGDKGLVVREALSGAVLMAFTGQQGRIGDLAFSPDGRTLASATSDSTVMLWTIPQFASAKPGPWQRERTEELWNMLRGDAQIAYQAMADLHAGGDEAVAILKDKIYLETEEERRLIQQSLADLGSAQFRTRETATTRLEKWGFRLKPHLAETLAKTNDLEQKRRLIVILNRYKNIGIDPEELRLNRSVFLLERIGTPGAQVVLETLARGHMHDLTAQSARGALARLQKASAKTGS